MNTIIRFILLTPLVVSLLSGCRSYDDLLPNPNVASEGKSVPASLLLPRVQFDLYNGGGVTDRRAGNVYEGPWEQVMRWNQFIVSNNLYYGGKNAYDWSSSASMYDVLKNVNQMDAQSAQALGTTTSAYAALAKFFRAYAFIWQTQRVGDTPAMQAGQGLTNLTPAYDSQKAIYARSLAMLDTANTMLGLLAGTNSSAAVIDGDIYYGNNISQWRKLINTYRLRVLISLSKRATDNSDLNIPGQFATILGNPTKYPIMTSNSDNLQFTFNSAYNTYPHTPADGNNNYQNVGATYLQLTTATQDPRTFIAATPAPAQLTAGKKVTDFSAYVGSNIGQAVGDLFTNSTAGRYSFVNYQRYYSSVVGPESYIIIGYPELCFNIAEAINRGWATGDAATYYNKGINASLSFYGLTDGQTLTIGDLTGKALGTVTVSLSQFLNNSAVVYKGNNADGLAQILNQKYVAFWQNSGWEAFYNWRRTGYPQTFTSTGGGINATGVIPRRWQYPVDEQTYNTTNYQSAVQSQYGGTDDLNKDIWSLK
ncbi:SusD-like starch-binding protein associating with outer membrane [Spirosoma oryzae]|uniref:SusD-like starch-binding protein associating with outer membrane n=1 Tax=Spirosoma oryzae TaxID=1469603 RepID=A0A2T0RHX5_9BACT|nr:SusD/RagB family nutrient-binding outer membrane lipoprotein [Spirosoma oryzae]PRY20758.1 SusD-like starch-binding protein associating with outer membrane [Spirosoma oryzae]